ncbi:MAG: ThuA domain-containing protein [Planctomycetota bacterium]|jgi:trehalose utilization protein
MSAPIRVTVWNEFRHEKSHDAVKAVYPDGMHKVIAECLAAEPDMEVRTATLDEPEHGLTDDVLDSTDVMLWWGHMAHNEVKDEIARKVQKRVWQGMGLVPLHSAHMSKPFRFLMGTGCMLKWREVGERERLWVVEPGHPIVEGVGDYIQLEHTEMYGERFDVPAPDELVFISWFQGGEVFRSGCCYNRGAGKIFYFRPGHETFPIFKDPEIQRVLKNAVRWARPVEREPIVQGNYKPLEKIEPAE